MINPQHTSGEYPPIGIPQRNGSLGGQSLEHMNLSMGQPPMARNRIPSLSASTISSVDDDHSPRHGSSFYHPTGPPSFPHSDVNNLNGSIQSYGDIHSYHFNSMGQRTELPGNVHMGLRHPTFDMYNNNTGAFLSPPGYTTGPVQPNYPSFQSRAPMIPSTGLTYDKVLHHQDLLNRQPSTSYGLQDTFSGDPTIRAMSHEPIRESPMQVHPQYLQERRALTQIPLQHSTANRDFGDNQYMSMFGPTVNQDRGVLRSQDPYTIHDMRVFDSNRASTVPNATKAEIDLEGTIKNHHQYSFPLNNTVPQSYVDPRSSYTAIHSEVFARPPPQSFVHPNQLYSYTDPNIPLMGDGNSLYKLDHPNNIIPSREGNAIYDQQPRPPVLTDQSVDNLALFQSSLQISPTHSANGPAGDIRQYLRLESNFESALSSNPSQPLLQKEDVLLSEDQYSGSSLFSSSNNLGGTEAPIHIQNVDYMKEQTNLNNASVEVQENDVKVSPLLSASSVRTQDKSYLTVLQSNSTQKDTTIQGASIADITAPKWKQAVATPVPSASLTTTNINNKVEPKYLYNVKFKRATEVFTLDNHPMAELKPGSFVKVEADRGHDMGTVVSRMPFSDYDAESRQSNASERFDKNILEKSKGQNNECTIPTLKKILRVATADEIALLQVKQKDEDDILNQCKSKAKQRGLTMNVIDAEYQFDRNKLTFYFQAQGRVDFRDLVKDLFGICKTRIWMQQIDKKPSSSSEASN